MSNYTLILFGCAAVVAGEAVVWHIAIFVICKLKSILTPDSYDAPPNPAPRISVIVAARNEEHNIEACVNSLLEQDYPDFEVIAVDDRSEDRTPALLRQLQDRSNGKLQVVTIRKLEDGWFGKNNAMREGVARATSDWLCFTDADCWCESRNMLTVAIRDAEEHDADFLSLLPWLEERDTWERIVQPACAIMMVSWFLPLRVNSPKFKIAYSNGQFMLVKRSCYEGIGGHRRVRAELNEDMVMGRVAKEEGYKLRIAENQGLSKTRMYVSFSEAWSGWSRIFHGSIPSVLQLGLAAIWHIVFAIGPWIGFAVSLAGWALAPADSSVPWSTAVWVWAVALIAHQSVLWRVYGLMHFRRIWSVAHFLGSAVLVGMLFNAMLKTLGLSSTTWRGVTYRSGKLERDRVLPTSTTQPARPSLDDGLPTAGGTE